LKTAFEHDSKNANSSDRRNHARYRFSAPVTVRKADGTRISSMSVEISQSGMSIATTENLQSGDPIKIEPVGGAEASAVIRHRHGNFYGLEFIHLAPAQADRIKESCRTLPIFRTNSLNI
jgi:PilZ domain-containing protein